MNNYKIKVNNEAESKEAQELFFELGYGWTNELEKKVTTSQDAINEGYSSNYQIFFIYAEKDGRLLHDTNDQDAYKCYVESHAKELTLPQLRDLVAQSKSTEQDLISGADAKLAWAKGEDLLIDTGTGFHDLTDNYYLAVFDRNSNKFKRKPRTITLNVEIPAPFEPKNGDPIYFIDHEKECGWSWITGYEDIYKIYIQFGAWRTEEEIKKVVAAIRGIKG